MYSRGSAHPETVALAASYHQSPRNDVERVQERKHLRVKSLKDEGTRCIIDIRDYSQLQKRQLGLYGFIKHEKR